MSADRLERPPRGPGDAMATEDWTPSIDDAGTTAIEKPRRPAAAPGDGVPLDPAGVTVPSFSALDRSLPRPAPIAPVTGEPRPWSGDLSAVLRGRTPAFPVPGWDRYACVRFLGEGGMGKVFLARDLRLDREVAIKFVRGDSRDHTLRLLAEARAQAQVDHDRVCKVYEVDEVHGEVYIAMQYIEGCPLGMCAAELTVEQKVMALRDAAEGVHAAHRVGIIHRDLNPNNIMVARDGEGLRAYVMDFGLARDRKEGATETGTVMGTPHYMAPEQARGEVGRLDRRADIYSLGASLYVILTRTQPIPGDNGLEVLANIPLVEPKRPREIDPDVPADLEAITLKCLEKDRSRRYDSARALAEDLTRFLDGDPVLASRAGLWYRVRKRMHKHRRGLAIAAVVAVLLGGALAWGLEARREGATARREAAERERLARSFTERVERIEASARYAALAPLHDVRADHEEMRARVQELARDVEGAGPLARGPGHYALGRGALALGDLDGARRELEAAWAARYREPRVAYALALVLGAQYQRQLVAAERIRSEEARAAQKRVIEQTTREPALAYLKQGASAAVPSPAYVAALIAFYEGRHDDALAQLDAIAGVLPWFYEAPQLRGDVYFAKAMAAGHAGDRARALADFESGRKAYARAIAVGESVPELHAALAELEHGALLFDLYAQADHEAPFARGLAAIERALAAMPDHVPSLLVEARLWRDLAEARANRSQPVGELLDRALAASKRATAVAPAAAATMGASPSQAQLELSRVYWAIGQERQRRNQDPSEPLSLAVAASDAVVEDERGFDYWASRGLIFKVWADYQDAVGAPSEDNRGKAIDALQRALAMAPRSVPSLINLGGTYYMRAIHPRAPDPDADLAAASRALAQALEIHPRHAVGAFYQGGVLEQIALRTWARGGDPRPELGRALAAYRAGIEQNGRLPHLHNGAGTILIDQAIDAWERGGDPEPFLAEAQASFERAIAEAPDQPHGYNNVGEVMRRRADFARQRGGDPRPAAKQAIASFAQALARNPDEATHLMNLGRVHALLATYALDRGADPSASAAAAESALDQALARNPNDGSAHLTVAAVRAVRAQADARRGRGGDADFAGAAALFERALALQPDDQDARLDAGMFYRTWATWRAGAGQDPEQPVVRGLAIAEDLLRARPTWAAALALRGSLTLVRAQAGGGDAAARASAARDLAAGLAGNAALQRTFAREAAATGGAP